MVCVFFALCFRSNLTVIIVGTYFANSPMLEIFLYRRVLQGRCVNTSVTPTGRLTLHLNHTTRAYRLNALSSDCDAQKGKVHLRRVSRARFIPSIRLSLSAPCRYVRKRKTSFGCPNFRTSPCLPRAVTAGNPHHLRSTLQSGQCKCRYRYHTCRTATCRGRARDPATAILVPHQHTQAWSKTCGKWILCTAS